MMQRRCLTSIGQGFDAEGDEGPPALAMPHQTFQVEQPAMGVVAVVIAAHDAVPFPSPLANSIAANSRSGTLLRRGK
jgi:hypothetical protein